MKSYKSQVRRYLIFIGLTAVLLVPQAAQAVSWIPIVPCGSAGQPPCTPCSLFQGLKNVTDMVMYGITGPIAAFTVVLAGGMMLLGGANPSSYSRGKTMLTNTLTGVAIILLAWVATNFLIKSIATGSDGDAWYEFTCPRFLAELEADTTEVTGTAPAGLPPAPATPPRPAGTSEEGWYRALAAAQIPTVPYPRQNSPSLIDLVDCIYKDPVVAALALPKPTMTGSARQTTGIFTYDNNHTVCNYTRGKRLYGSCSHGSNGSCHYGGKTGTKGAEAVDMNAKLKEVLVPGLTDKDGRPVSVYASEERLFCELYRVLITQRKCPTFGSGNDIGLLNFEDEHTHISTKACDGDGLGAGPVPGVGGAPVKPCSPLVSPSSGQR